MAKEHSHEDRMQAALQEAHKAFKAQEVPIGAVVISPQGTVIGAGFNQVEIQKTQIAHAELLALKQAAQVVGDWRLEECMLYVTLEPCTMCYAAAVLSRVKGIVFGTESPVFGYKKDRDCFIKPVDTQLTITGGIKEKECSDLLQQFFKLKRPVFF